MELKTLDILLDRLKRGEFDFKRAQFYYVIGLACKNRTLTSTEEKVLVHAWKERDGANTNKRDVESNTNTK